MKFIPANHVAVELLEKCPECRGTGHSGNLDDELCSFCDGGGRKIVVVPIGNPPNIPSWDQLNSRVKDLEFELQKKDDVEKSLKDLRERIKW